MSQTARLDSLQTWDRNYRRGDIQAIKRSIVRFGFNGALRIRAGVVMAGNHSLLALRELEAAKVKPPTGITVEKGKWLVPVISLDHLSDDEATAFAIADNRTSDLGEYDEESLRVLTDELLKVDATLIADAGYDLTVDFGAMADQAGEEAERLRKEAEEEEGSEQIADKAESSEPGILLKWGEWKIHLTDDEAEALSIRAKEHLERTGTTFGFVRAILGLS